MKNLNLPDPIVAYFEADKQDGLAVAACFTPDGQVTDEGKTHTGPAAIEAWKADASQRYTYAATPRALATLDRKYIVTAHVAGNFPGSPVDLRYAFTLEHGKIATMEITP